jgi:hypothetical protein
MAFIHENDRPLPPPQGLAAQCNLRERRLTIIDRQARDLALCGAEAERHCKIWSTPPTLAMAACNWHSSAMLVPRRFLSERIM